MPVLCTNTIVEAVAQGRATAPQICDRVGVPFTGRIYGKLRAMERVGLLVGSWGEPTPERGGRRPRYYALPKETD